MSVLVHPDPNTGDTVYESDAIVQHLYRQYGGGVDNIPKVKLRSIRSRLSLLVARNCQHMLVVPIAPVCFSTIRKMMGVTW